MKKQSCLIRRATVEDANLLAELGQRTYLQHFSAIWGVDKLQAYLLEHYSRDTISAQLADVQNHSFLIASVAERPVGFVKINWNRAEPTTGRPGAELERLHIDAPFTGRGIGKLLLKSSIVLAGEQNEDEFWLQVLIDNEEAQRFFRRNGFATIGQQSFKTDVTPTALAIMVLSLAANPKASSK